MLAFYTFYGRYREVLEVFVYKKLLVHMSFDVYRYNVGSLSLKLIK